MRIAIDATYSVSAEPSGIAIYSRELLRDLPTVFPDDEFLACMRPKQWRERPANHLPNLRIRILQWPLPIGRADLFHALNQRVDWRPAPAVVTTFHDLFVMTAEYATPEFRVRFTQQAQRAAQNSDLIIAVSQYTADQVHDLLGVERARIRVVYHGVRQTSLTIPERRREQTILFVGALQTRKNLLRLIDAFEQTTSAWRLVLAGSGNGYGAADILERVHRSPRRQQIEITGYVDERRLLELYAEASIFVFPSLDEGFGIPILEAMQHEIPVLTSKRSATAEVAGDAAYLVDPLDTDAMAEGLQRLSTDEELRNELVARGRDRVKKFSWSRAAHETYSVYQELTT